jgi:hypothetical protein
MNGEQLAASQHHGWRNISITRIERVPGGVLPRLTQSAGAFDGPHSVPTAGSARPTLRAVFAIHSHRLVEPYNARSLGCGFSGGTTGDRSNVASSRLPRLALNLD